MYLSSLLPLPLFPPFPPAELSDVLCDVCDCPNDNELVPSPLCCCAIPMRTIRECMSFDQRGQ